MTQHLVLTLNPSAKYDWDKCELRDPLTHSSADFSKLVAEAVGKQPGKYLVSVHVEVQVLSQQPVETETTEQSLEVVAA